MRQIITPMAKAAMMMEMSARVEIHSWPSYNEVLQQVRMQIRE